MTRVQSTRCPHCHTAFRVTTEQLAAARGSVRCGGCLQVFNARDYLQDDELNARPVRQPKSEVTPPPSQHTRAQTEPASKKPKSEASTRLKPSPTARPAPPATPAPEPARTAPAAPEAARHYEEDELDLLFDEDAGATAFAISEDDDDDFLFIDDDAPPAIQQVDEDDPPEPEPDELEFSDSFMTLDSRTPVSPELADRQASHSKSAGANADDSWALDMLADMEREEERQLPASHEQMSLQPETPDDGQVFNTQRPARSSAALEPERNNLEAAFSLSDLDELTEQAPPTHRHTGWLALASGVLVLLLTTQLLCWERDRLSQQPVLQPVYSLACTWGSCDFMNTSPNASALRALSSVLRPLPDGRMRLDAVFVNRGDRPAPFPLLVLTLENAQGEVVADGLFAPDDYVGGELRPTDAVPPGRPVSISLNINRPVDDLSNYRLSFHY